MDANGGPAVAALSDLHGDLVATFTTSLVTSTSFDPFGAVTAQTGAATTLGYQGEYTDPDTSKVNMHARWYQPGTGTFTSRDTATLNPNPSVQANRYTYANASPLTGIDPTGHSTVSTGVGSGGSTGYAGVGCSSGYLCLGAAQNGGFKYPPAGVADMTYGVGGSGCVDSSSRICHETYGQERWWSDFVTAPGYELRSNPRFSDEEAKRIGVMPNGRPVPKRVDNLVIDFWEASVAAQDDFMSKYTPVVSDEALAITWAVTAAYHNQFPSCSCFAGALGKPAKVTTKTATHRAADEFARIWAKVKGPTWTNADGALYGYHIKHGNRDKAKAMVQAFKEKWVRAYKDVIVAAAVYWGIPPVLLGGIAYGEVGGDPPIIDDLAFLKRMIFDDRETLFATSFGSVSMQFGLAMDLLGYTKVDVTLGSQIIKLLKNPASNLFLAGKHLANLHGQRPGWDEKETRRVVAAWNGSGPDAQRYADRYFKALPTVKSIIGR